MQLRILKRKMADKEFLEKFKLYKYVEAGIITEELAMDIVKAQGRIIVKYILENYVDKNKT